MSKQITEKHMFFSFLPASTYVPQCHSPSLPDRDSVWDTSAAGDKWQYLPQARDDAHSIWQASKRCDGWTGTALGTALRGGDPHYIKRTYIFLARETNQHIHTKNGKYTTS